MLNQNGIVPTIPMTTATDGNSMGGQNWIWILLIFLLFSRGDGFGLGGGATPAANAATNLINNDFLYTQQKVDALSQALISQTTQLNQSLNNGFNDVRMGIADLGYRQQQCCCDQLRAIDGVNYNASQNTCTITNAIRDEARATRDLITSNTMQDLRDRNVELSQMLNNCNQSAVLTSAINGAINTRFPQPVPASVVGYGYPGFSLAPQVPPQPYFGCSC